METAQQYFSVFALMVGIAIGMAFMLPQSVVTPERPAATPQNITGAHYKITSEYQTPRTAIYHATNASVVLIRAEGDDGTVSQGAQGSGFIYDRQGHIVTNQHVVEQGVEYEVHFASGKQLEAKLVGADPYSDLAVLKVDPSKVRLRPLPLANYTNVQVGEGVVAIGNPFGLDSSMTSGIVSQKDRLLRTQGDFSIPNVIQTDAAINPGNSGGPLLNMEGEVIGVNTAISSRSRTFAGVGFAVSVETVKRVIPQLIATGDYEHPWIGVSGVDITPEIQRAMNLNVSSGFLIIEVVDQSPAAAAGMQAGDREVTIDGRQMTVGGDVIVGINGNKMRKIDDILNYLAKETRVGETVTINIIRDGERMDVPLTLDRRPPASSQ